MKRSRVIAGVIVVVLVAAGCLYFYQQARAQTPPPEATAVTNPSDAPDDGFVAAEGVIIPLRDANLSFQSGGRVAEILIAEGALVQAGDPLLQLETTALKLVRAQAQSEVAMAEAGLVAAQTRLAAAEAAVQTAQTGVAEAQAQLALLQAGPRPEAVAAAQFDVVAAQSGVAQAAANRDAALQIPDSQILAAQANVAAWLGQLRAVQDEYDAILNNCYPVTLPDGSSQTVCPEYGPVEEAKRAELQQAQLQYQAAQAALDALQEGPTSGQQAAASGAVSVALANQALAAAQLALAQAGPTAEQIRQAEIGVELAHTAVAQAEAGILQAQAGVAQAEAALLQAQTNLQAAEVALARTTVRAPFAGTVAAVNVEVGDLAAPGAPIVSLADFSGWLVETTDLTELDVVNINPGDPVEIRVDAISGETLHGTIQTIDSMATPSRGDVTYAVTIALDDATRLPLRWGMTVFVDVSR